MRRIQLVLLPLIFGCTESGSTPQPATPPPATDPASPDAKDEAEIPAPAANALPDAATLLAESVDAVGGKAKLDSIHSFHLEGTIGAPKHNLTGKVETWWKDGEFYVVQTIPGLGINRSGKHGDTIWAEEPINGLRKLEGAEAEQHMWASSLLLTADWKKFFDKATTTGTRTLDGKDVYDIELSAKSGAKLTVTLDANSKLMVEQAFDVQSPLGPMPVKIRSTDYRDVEGMKIPYKQVTDASLMELTQELTLVEVNPQIDAALFVMPTEDVPVVDAAKPSTIADPPADAKQ